MALISSSGCGRQVSVGDEKCPHCGNVFYQNVSQPQTVSNPTPKAKKMKKLWMIGGAAFAVLLIILLIPSTSGEKYYQMAKETSDDNLRLEYLGKSVKKGHREAMFNLAYSMLNANTSREEMTIAFELMRKSAEDGYPLDQGIYGIILINGNYGLKKIVSERYKWLEMSANNVCGEFPKMLDLAYYSGGVGVPRDMEKANFWLAKAAAQDVEGAESALHVINGLDSDGQPFKHTEGWET